ncbi:MAG TPA: glycosyltransferase [Usitatibacter sp.]|nr:glycosyltransferase [Usitatibacter sp.]
MIDVVIPVYKGYEQTRRCIESVLASAQREPFETVLVDDASPEPRIRAYLDEVAAQGRATLLRNEENLGFVRSVNRGMALHADRDVVLLNSDAEVANDWLDRLRACAHGAPDVATVTPFSNNATICSYPFEGWAGRVPGTLGLAALDRLFARVNAGRAIELPTAVGFCMDLRSDALSALGAFDAERFGRGYGEENDFCMRALKSGRRNLLAADVFVYHEGSVSFSDEGAALRQSAGKALVEAHPDYPVRVHDFLVADPANDLRMAVDRARVEAGTAEAQEVLAERADERARLMRGLWHIERLAEERDSTIGQLNRGLDHARQLLADRDAEIARRGEEIERLRAGLAHAEKLAFERLAELQRVHASPIWKVVLAVGRVRRLLRRKAPDAA